MIEDKILYITHTDCGIPELKKHGLGIGPNLDLDAAQIQPLREVFSTVLVYDLWKEYARVGAAQANQAILDLVIAHQPRYILWHSMSYEILESTLQKMRQCGAVVLGWFSDDEVRFDNYSRWYIPYLDYFLTVDRKSVSRYEALGAKVIYTMWGSNPEVFKKLDAPIIYDVTFVGRKFGERGKWIDYLNSRDLNVQAFGYGWNSGYLSMEAMVKVFNTSKINLCFVQSYGDGTPLQIKARIFEICMSGGFLLCEYIPGIEKFFEIGQEMVTFTSLPEAEEKIRYYLAHEAERQKIAEAGWQRAQRDHTMAERFRKIFAEISAPAQPTLSNVNTPLKLPAEVRPLPSNWHLDWAKGLLLEGYPRQRWKEEVDLALFYDPENQDARFLKTVERPMPASLARFALTSRLAYRRLKQDGRSRLAKVVVLKKGKQLGDRLSLRVKDYRRMNILDKQRRKFTPNQLSSMQENVSRFLESLRVKGEPAGRYYYSPSGTTPILYASVYAALLLDLLNKIADISTNGRQEWVDYINSFQCEDGLYRDAKLDNDIAETADWWGWRHLSAHVVSAITALGGKTRYPFDFLKFLYGQGQAYQWIKELPWRERVEDVSNTVMNYGVLLQYERDFWDRKEAGVALNEIFAFLDENINSKTGLWWPSVPLDAHELSLAVQTSYHLWNLYFYDHRTIPYMNSAMDGCLATQNRLGGYGAADNSSACEDIDSIDPLCRFYPLTNYRHEDIEVSLQNALKWVAVNQMTDGGFVFRRFESFEYGHWLMKTDPEESNLFATWFRMLSTAYIRQVLFFSGSTSTLHLGLRCPGYQFWNVGSI